MRGGRPISAYWTLSFVPQHCINENIHITIHGSLNILFDFCAVLIPIPIVLSLNLPLRQRIIVALLFGIGFVVCLAGIVRTYYMYKATAGYHDVTWDAYPAWLGTAVELYLGIVSPNFPQTPPPNLVTQRLMRGSSALRHHRRNLSSLATSQNCSSRLEARTLRSPQVRTLSPQFAVFHRAIRKGVWGWSSTIFLRKRVRFIRPLRSRFRSLGLMLRGHQTLFLLAVLISRYVEGELLKVRGSHLNQGREGYRRSSDSPLINHRHQVCYRSQPQPRPLDIFHCQRQHELIFSTSTRTSRSPSNRLFGVENVDSISLPHRDIRRT
jgi:hypothetical protein